MPGRSSGRLCCVFPQFSLLSLAPVPGRMAEERQAGSGVPQPLPPEAVEQAREAPLVCSPVPASRRGHVPHHPVGAELSHAPPGVRECRVTAVVRVAPPPAAARRRLDCAGWPDVPLVRGPGLPASGGPNGHQGGVAHPIHLAVVHGVPVTVHLSGMSCRTFLLPASRQALPRGVDPPLVPAFIRAFRGALPSRAPFPGPGASGPSPAKSPCARALSVLQGSTVTGLSPRVRGSLLGRRFLAAPAGLTALVGPAVSPTRGSSPRARGAGRPEDPDRAVVRFIPATAGADRPALRSADSAPGSSPRVRGALNSVFQRHSHKWSNPACSGNPRPGRTSTAPTPAPPCVCGGVFLIISTPAASHGSSPLLRGIYSARRSPVLERRFIPAMAGAPGPLQWHRLQGRFIPVAPGDPGRCSPSRRRSPASFCLPVSVNDSTGASLHRRSTWLSVGPAVRPDSPMPLAAMPHVSRQGVGMCHLGTGRDTPRTPTDLCCSSPTARKGPRAPLSHLPLEALRWLARAARLRHCSAATPPARYGSSPPFSETPATVASLSFPVPGSTHCSGGSSRLTALPRPRRQSRGSARRPGRKAFAPWPGRRSW